jgi:hypothetical protein
VALQKRIQTGREEQKKQRHLDLERLLQRYQNVKAEVNLHSIPFYLFIFILLFLKLKLYASYIFKNYH